jgi:hypothetical protein
MYNSSGSVGNGASTAKGTGKVVSPAEAANKIVNADRI